MLFADSGGRTSHMASCSPPRGVAANCRHRHAMSITLKWRNRI